MDSHESSRRRRNKFIWLNTRRCDACWKCVEVCPKQVFGKIEMLWHRHVVIRDEEACNGCRKCVHTCESGAIEVINLPKSQSAGV